MAENKSTSLRKRLTEIVGEVFQKHDFDFDYGEVTVSNRLDLAQFTCAGAFHAAKKLRKNPKELAEVVIKDLQTNPIFKSVAFASPGYINMNVADDLIVSNVSSISKDPTWGCGISEKPLSIVLDFGGPNIAKPLHVGHLRSAIIGESLKRICRHLGHKVLGDVHLGDWGLQMGLLIHELQLQRPELPYFAVPPLTPFPQESPVTIGDLEILYPTASNKAKNDEAYNTAAKEATLKLQQGDTAYRALWQQFVNVSIQALKSDYARLNVEFDLWLGESNVQEEIPALLENLSAQGIAYESQGALVVDVAQETDEQPVPPLLLRKSDGAALYSTTDLATIVQRKRDYNPDLILYVVDNRQKMHFIQVFRCAKKAQLISDKVSLEHIGFGTMNGKDGKPFKTRSGGTMRLSELIQMVADKATERLVEANIVADLEESEKAKIARSVGIASLKFADLSGVRTNDYVFDLDKFSSFEGKTGPYLLYMAVRAKSILRKAQDNQMAVGELLLPASEPERNLLLKLAEFPDFVLSAFKNRAPSDLCNYAFELCTSFARFYAEIHILREPDPARRGSYLKLAEIFLATLTKTLSLLSIEVPNRM